MSLQITCQSCGQTYSFHESLAGTWLPCNACGKMLVVAAEEERPFPRSRQIQQSNAPNRPKSNRADGRKRRKPYGSKAAIVGLSIGGAILVSAVVAVIAILGDSLEAVMKDWISVHEERVRILESITNESSARAALPRLIENNSRTADVARRMRRFMTQSTDPQFGETVERFQSEYSAVLRRIFREKIRTAKIPGAARILSEVDKGGGEKPTEIEQRSAPGE